MSPERRAPLPGRNSPPSPGARPSAGDARVLSAGPRQRPELMASETRMPLIESPAARSGAVRDKDARRFVVATPLRSVCDDNARALERHGWLRFLALGTRHGTAGVPPERTRLNPRIGLVTYAAGRTLRPFHSESVRFRLLPWFDRWVLKQLEPGDHIISSYGYTNECFKFVRRHGGKTFVDAGNSHIENFWEILTEENRRRSEE